MYEDRLLTYIDILGFKELIKRSADIQAILNKFVDNNSLKINSIDFEIINFSDTILFYTKRAGFNQQLFDDIIFITQKFVLEMLRYEIPVRGVITYGEFNVDVADNTKIKLFWGKGLIDAYEAESTENIVGLFILPQAFHGYSTYQIKGLEDVYPWKWHVKYDCRVLVNLFPSIATIPKDDYDLTYYIDEDPEILTEIGAHSFLCRSREKYSGKIADKYRNALELSDRFIYHDISQFYRLAEESFKKYEL